MVSQNGIFVNHWQVQSIHQSICKQYKLHVCQRSPPVKRWSINQCQSVSCQTANRVIRTASSHSHNDQWICLSNEFFLVLWEVLSDTSMLDESSVNALRKHGANLTKNYNKKKLIKERILAQIRWKCTWDAFSKTSNFSFFCLPSEFKTFNQLPFLTQLISCCWTSCSAVVPLLQTAGAFLGPMGN